MNKIEFLERAKAAAIASSRTSGFPPGVTVAQAALESAWGESRLSRDANNYFGIKARTKRKSAAYPTTEVVNGETVRVTARFARYDSIAECFEDRDCMIATLRCYGEARKCAGDAKAFIAALAKHWATDPKYAEKLRRIYKANSLDVFDSRIPNRQSAAIDVVMRSANSKE